MVHQVENFNSLSSTFLSHNTSKTVKIFYENSGSSILSGGMTTLGTVFISGQVPAGQDLVARINGATVPVQMDVKTTYPDGSARMAVLTLPRPDLAPGQAVAVELTAAALPDQPALNLRSAIAAHDVTVQIAGPKGQLKVDVLDALDAALADGTASFWQKGPLATQARVEIPLEGTQRLVFDVTAFKGGGLEVEAQFNNDRAMEATGGRVAYDVKVTMNGKVMADHRLDQALFQNWHETFSSNGRDGGQGLGSPAKGWLNIRQDIERFQEAGAVPDYNLDIGVNEPLLQKWFNATQAPGWDAPLSNNGLLKDMFSAGGREDIGFTTAANTAWLMTQDPRAAAFALGQAEAANAVPWNMWDARSDTWLGTDAYPRLWTDPRGGTGKPGDAASRGLTMQSDNAGWKPDPAHLPDLSFVPYLMTGERWMLDNLQAQASWTIMSHLPESRGFAGDVVVAGNQVRGAAWALRQIDHAAWVSPDGSVEKAAFQEASDANWKWLVDQIPAWTKIQGEAHGYMMGTYGIKGAMPPWQQDFFASTAIAAAARGQADAMKFLEWQTNFLVGRFQQDGQGFPAHDGAAYLLAIGDAASGARYTTWEEIGAKTAALNWSNGEGWGKSQGYFAQLALATLAGIAKVTGSAEAKKAYWELMADAPPFTSDSAFRNDPTYAIARPTDGGGAPPPVIVTPPPVVVAPPPVVVAPPPVVVTPPPPVVVAPPPEGPMRDLALVLSGDAYLGLPEALVKVNGVEVFRGFVDAVGAQRSTISLGKVALHDDAVVTVRFVQDASGSGPGQDRNLYVRDILVDGASTGQRANFYSAGEKAFALPGQPEPVKIAPPPAVPETPDTRHVQLVLAGDAWKGQSKAVVALDGQEVFRGAIQVGQGRETVLDLGQVARHEDSRIVVTFQTDKPGAGGAEARPLMVKDVLVDGVATGQSMKLLTAGRMHLTLEAEPQAKAFALAQEAPFTFAAAAQPLAKAAAAPRTLVLGEGEDVLRFALKGDAWKGQPEYMVVLDGEVLGGVNSIAARNHRKDVEFLEIHGDFTPGAHEVAIRYLNDVQGPGAADKRNIHVTSVSFNGDDLGMGASLLKNGDALFYF